MGTEILQIAHNEFDANCRQRVFDALSIFHLFAGDNDVQRSASARADKVPLAIKVGKVVEADWRKGQNRNGYCYLSLQRARSRRCRDLAARPINFPGNSKSAIALA